MPLARGLSSALAAMDKHKSNSEIQAAGLGYLYGIATAEENMVGKWVLCVS